MGAEHGAIHTQLDGTIQLPDGRQVPITVTVDWSELEKAGVVAPDALLLRAVEVFGKIDKALSWLNTPHPMFHSQTPRARAQTDEGRAAVLDVLFDLEHGFPA
jgi:Protein of unknown function (DUF2384)